MLKSKLPGWSGMIGYFQNRPELSGKSIEDMPNLFDYRRQRGRISFTGRAKGKAHMVQRRDSFRTFRSSRG